MQGLLFISICADFTNLPFLQGCVILVLDRGKDNPCKKIPKKGSILDLRSLF